MGDDFALGATLTEILRNLVDQIVRITPRILTALLLILLGLIVAKIMEKVVSAVLEKARLDRLLTRVGLTGFAERLGVRAPLSRMLARLTFYLLIVLFAQAAADALRLTAISDAFRAFFSFLPHVLAALFVFLVGNVVAQFTGKAVTNSTRESGVEYAGGLGHLVTVAILMVVSIMAVAQLGIDTTLLRNLVFVFLTVIGTSITLAFGLGTREIARNLVAGYYVRKLFQVGDEVEIGKYRGTLKSVTQTKTLLDVQGRTVTIANKVILEETVEHAPAPE